MQKYPIDYTWRNGSIRVGNIVSIEIHFVVGVSWHHDAVHICLLLKVPINLNVNYVPPLIKFQTFVNSFAVGLLWCKELSEVLTSHKHLHHWVFIRFIKFRVVPFVRLSDLQESLCWVLVDSQRYADVLSIVEHLYLMKSVDIVLVQFAYSDLRKLLAEILYLDPENSVIFLLEIKSLLEFWSPFRGLVRPVAFPLTSTPRIPHLNYPFLPISYHDLGV